MATATKSGIQGRLDGRLLLPGDTGYDDTRTVWNGMIDHRPRMIVRAASTNDVVTAVRAAREFDLEIGVRCGGHSGVGHAVPHDGLMIDLTPLAGVHVDPAGRRARIQGGALLGVLDRATQRYGLATTAGNVSHTGVGGLTLGGGMGWLARRYGLACDNVESYTMVTAEGDVVRVSRTERPDLFWGLRGGGGNFGIVTEFEFRLHPIGTRTLVAEYTFPLDKAVPALKAWRDLNAEAPREATFTAGIGQDDTATLGFVWIGDPERADGLVRRFETLGRPAAARVAEMSYVDLQRREDTVERHSLRRYSKGHYLRRFPDAAIEAFVHRGAPDGRHRPAVGLQAYGGAIADVPDEDSAFSHRATLFEFGTGTSWTAPADDEVRIAAARRSAAAMAPFADGVYVNALNDEGAEGVRRAYSPEKLAKLVALKNAYDPHNVFHLNHNIRPDQ
ncbi:FAD-binding oxidoreductase [Thermomonospora umbrina]|uniref:FAD/FMN-containing dehydrogenase n=1 Tax=Thermomonospora umbrina TaxID=111806 RepID=A0A3D9SW25_9ACTN|nr:FAD-binding oxidoreductase [Thermomonospora umbrina]REE97195.1 FAD/FMN-containing dehydrogenase [Thermomonospora umbrina]